MANMNTILLSKKTTGFDSALAERFFNVNSTDPRVLARLDAMSLEIAVGKNGLSKAQTIGTAKPPASAQRLSQFGMYANSARVSNATGEVKTVEPLTEEASVRIF